MITKEAIVMDLLTKIAKANNVDYKLTKQILKIEKEHVYQKSRHTRVSIKQLISDKSTEEEK